MSDNLILIAPRPVRLCPLASPMPLSPRLPRLSHALPDAPLNQVRLTEDEMPTDERTLSPSGYSANSRPGSTRASPRLATPADALEEFLSILRSSGPISFSPTLRSHRHTPSTLPSFIYERPYPYMNSYTKGSSIAPATGDGPDLELHTPAIALPSASIHPFEQDDSDLDDLTSLRSNIFGVLESPISRSLTRNPFHRHPSYEKAYVNLFAQAPTIQLPTSPIPISVSPASIPLPADSDDGDVL